jgi:hypothetical protein
MSGGVHHRAEGDVTGLGAASRAGTHVSCATGQESDIWLCMSLGSLLFDHVSYFLFHFHHPSSSDVVRIHHDGLIYL